MKNIIKKKYFYLLFTALFFVVIAYLNMSSNKTIIEQKSNDIQDKIILNKLPQLAGSFSVENVELKNIKNKLKEEAKVYKVDKYNYTEEEITEVIKKGKLGTMKKNNEIDGDLTEYIIDNNKVLYYFKKTGALHYIDNSDNDLIKTENKEITEKNLKEIADDFIEKTDLFDLKLLKKTDMFISESVELSNGTLEAIEYTIVYSVIPPKGIDKFVGGTPGIRISINKEGTIKSFISINKEITEMKTMYKCKNTKEIEQSITGGTNILVSSEKEKIDSLTINNMEYVLFLDPISIEQEYSIPCYSFEGSSQGNEVDVLIPVIEDKYIEFN